MNPLLVGLAPLEERKAGDQRIPLRLVDQIEGFAEWKGGAAGD